MGGGGMWVVGVAWVMTVVLIVLVWVVTVYVTVIEITTDTDRTADPAAGGTWHNFLTLETDGIIQTQDAANSWSRWHE